MNIFFVYLTVYFLLLSCGGSSTVDNNPLPVSRGGQSVSTPVSAYEDFSPAVSANGSKILFVSTRTQVGASFPRRLWKTIFTSNSGASTPSRLLNSDRFDFEQNPVLSNDGASVLFTGRKDQLISIVLAKYDDPSSGQVVTTSFLNTPQYVFSQDSLYFAFVTSSSSTQSVLSIASVAAPTTLTNYLVAGEAITGLFWVNSATGYQLAWSSTTAAFDKKVSSVNFSSLSALPSVIKQIWLSGLVFDDQLFQSNSTFVTAAIKISPDGAKTTSSVGNITSTTVFNRRNEIQLYNFPSTTPQIFTGYTPMNARFRNVSSDGSALFALGLFPIQCQGDGNAIYQNIISIFNVANNSESKIIPRTGIGANTWDVVNDSCIKKRSDGTDGAFDFQISNLVVNANGTGANSVALYVTPQSGDQEVRLIETLSGLSKIYDVSSNRKPQ